MCAATCFQISSWRRPNCSRYRARFARSSALSFVASAVRCSFSSRALSFARAWAAARRWPTLRRLLAASTSRGCCAFVRRKRRTSSLRQRSPSSTAAVMSKSFLSFSGRPQIHADSSVRLGPAASGFEACAATLTRSSSILRNSINAWSGRVNSSKPAGTGGSSLSSSSPPSCAQRSQPR